jgi:DNA invertase Pin-like site-specific DNA recombinase
VLGGLAEFERALIRARTGEGRSRAKARGVRPPKLQHVPTAMNRDSQDTPEVRV